MSRGGAGSRRVEVRNHSFFPNSLTIGVGDSVSWCNHSECQHNLCFSKRGPVLSRGNRGIPLVRAERAVAWEPRGRDGSWEREGRREGASEGKVVGREGGVGRARSGGQRSALGDGEGQSACEGR